MRRIALTGGIATGKSHVRAQFDELGVPTIDADILARDAVAPGSAGLQAVRRRFGEGVIAADGSLDRRALAAVVFEDAVARRNLEGIIHPYVRTRMDEWFASLDTAVHPFAIADIPLLYETGRDGDFDAVIVTACDPATQVRRIMARDGSTEAEARQRLAAQLPIEDKVRRGDFVIRTEGTHDETAAQVRDIHRRLSGA